MLQPYADRVRESCPVRCFRFNVDGFSDVVWTVRYGLVGEVVAALSVNTGLLPRIATYNTLLCVASCCLLNVSTILFQLPKRYTGYTALLSALIPYLTLGGQDP